MKSSLNADIYNVAQYVEEIKKKHIENVDEDTLMMSTFGYIGELFATQMRNNILMSSEWGLEAMPVTARFDKNILTHAIMTDVQNIDAIPAKMSILLGISETELLKNAGQSKYFILDNKTKITIDDFEFHFDYPIRIDITDSLETASTAKKSKVYIAKYDMTDPNPLSDVINPYLLPPLKMNTYGETFLFLQLDVRQVSYVNQYNKIVTDSSIENKTFDFEFDDQVAYFDMSIMEPNATEPIIIKPLIDGSPIPVDGHLYFYYQYIDVNRIRVKFIFDSYEPKLNSDITVRIQCTKGKQGIFTYKEDIIVIPESEKYVYNNMTMVAKPVSNSEYGMDRKDSETLKKIIPREALARGSITSTKDLENYFNMLADDKNKMQFAKKIDNPIERTYYSYLLIKDDYDNIIPSNTCDLKFKEEHLHQVAERYTINPGTIFKLDPLTDLCTIVDRVQDDGGFYYSTPYMIALSQQPVCMSYYLNILDINYRNQFKYINQDSEIQFICDTSNLKRQFKKDRNKYKFTSVAGQNISEEKNLVTVDPESGAITQNKFKHILLFVDHTGKPIRYAEAPVVYYNDKAKEFVTECVLETDDKIRTDSSINITNLKEVGTGLVSPIYLPRQTKVISYYLVKYDDVELGREDLDDYVPGLEGWSLSNIYSVDPGVDLFINYTEVMKSNIFVKPDSLEAPQAGYHYILEDIPMIKYQYIDDEVRINSLIEYLVNRKLYLDNALELLEDSFGIDFKFFNTYGPSRTFRIGFDKEKLDRINLTLKFRVRFDVSADVNLKDILIAEIKKYIENINNSGNLYISQLISHLSNNYKSIIAIEFVGINNYGSNYQYIEKHHTADKYIPEFININSNTSEYIPDIQIEVV